MTVTATRLFFAIVALQMVGLVAFAAIKQYVVASGTEVVLQQADPIDPRSLMQGDYAILDYEIARIPEYAEDRFISGDDVLVVLEKRGEVWEATEYFKASWLPKRRNEVFVRGEVQADGSVDFGIGTYFVPEGTGGAIERATDVKIKVSVSDDGDATVTGVILDGEDFEP